MPRVYVTGHRNPDTDSISAAIGYAELRRQTDPDNEYVPVRLGELNPQTSWAIERSGAPVPELLEHVQLRVLDVMRQTFPVAHQDDPVRVVGQELVREGLDLLPIIDDDGVLVGVLTERALARRYVRESRQASRLDSATQLRTLVDTLEGELLAGDPEQMITGRVWVLAMDLPSVLQSAAPGDIAVVGDRPDAQRRAVECGLGALVLSNGVMPSDELLAFADEQGTPVIRTALDSYVSGRMITLSSPCRALLEDEPFTVGMDDLVADISAGVKDVSYRAAIVVDDQRRPIGLVTRADLVRPRARRVLLVDHAEQAQSVPGVEEAEIVEILDHHHIGSIETKQPVIATFDPVGSTSTLVSERFDQAGIAPTPSTALMLLAAILSDTVILNSPTATPRDRTAMEQLARLVDVDPIAFGRDMFESASDVSSVPADQLVSRDAKEYELANGTSVAIAQIETVGVVPEERTEELLAAVRAACEQGEHRLFALMLTDVLARGTRLIVAGDVAFAEHAFDAPARDGVIDLPGVMSRKKQVAPRLLAA